MRIFDKIRLGDVVLFNPTERLTQGTVAKKVTMDKLQPFTRNIGDYEQALYTGGAKFRNGDTLMARITPCLENGKTAWVSMLDTDEVGFGSTEYIVLRNRDGITDSKFVYYFAINPWFRDIAIKSMVGSSGRQRVQQSVLENLEVSIPSLPSQRRIAQILGSLDDKIELNRQVNDNLERQAQAIFKSWFVDFEPFGGKMPSDWKKGCFGDISHVISGKRPTIREPLISATAKIPLIGASSVMGFTDDVLYAERILITGRVGTHGVIQRYSRPCWPSDNTLVIKSDYYEFAYQQLCCMDFHNMNRGSTQPLITQTDLKNVSVDIPDGTILIEFEDLVGALMKQFESNVIESEHLADMRNTLLPKLMSGELSVEDVERQL